MVCWFSNVSRNGTLLNGKTKAVRGLLLRQIVHFATLRPYLPPSLTDWSPICSFLAEGTGMVDSSRIEQTSLSEPSHAWSKTILYVEDEPFVREVTREVLEAAGYRVFSAGDASQAHRICSERCPHVDLLLTDVVLPGESGFLLAAKLKRENPSLRVLFVTGYPQQAGILRAENEDCLHKPFSTVTLLARVKRSLTIHGDRAYATVTLSASAVAGSLNDLSGDIRQ
jgi:CheY-like chemotaxis protein